MKIKILGTRGEIESSTPYHSRHSGVLIDKTILLDLGEKEFLRYQPKYILITHLHPDHAIFVKEPIKTKIPIYAPERYKKITIDSYQITAIPTHHSKKVKSVAYLIKKGKQKMLYTGDIIWIDKKYHHLFKNLDLVITEGSFIRKGGLVKKDKKTNEIYGHTGIPNLINLFKNFTKHILFIHFGTWFYKDIKKAKRKLCILGKKNTIAVRAGYDGMKINLDNLK